MTPPVESDEEASFSFTRLEGKDSSAEQQIDLPRPSSLTRQCWPQSYQSSINLYSRSTSFSHEQSEELCQEQSSDLFVYKLSDTEVPLINNTTHVYDFQHHSDHGLQPAGQSTFFQAVLNGINMLAGVGILSMPYAVSQGGWVGMSFLFIFASVCCYTGVLLRRCLDLNPHIVSYPDVGQAAFGRFGRIIISGMLYLELYAIAIEFLILEGSNLTQLVSFEGLDFGNFQLSSEEAFVILSALVMLPTVWLRDLSLLSYLSAGGVIACVTVFLAVAWTGIAGVGFTNYHGHFVNVQGFPIAVGLYAFCYCGHAVFPNIYGSMREQSKFSHVLVVSFIVCTLLYGSMAVLGFLMYGDAIESQVTLNLPRGQLATRIAIIATIVTPFAKYALNLTPLAAALEELLPQGWKARNLLMWGMIIRALLVVSTVIIALTVPFFAYLMALVGSLLSATVAITIPCLCYMKLFSGRIPLWERVLIVVFVALGIGACVVGTYSSILEIAKSLST